jgi:hypothetical protein
MKTTAATLLLLLFTIQLSAQTVTPEDGNWSLKHVEMSNTPEAAFMARTGDIDNLGFGWSAGFNPFSGNSTSSHTWPWTMDPADPDGTDRIMVISSFRGNPPSGDDGYTRDTSRPANSVRPIVLEYTPPATLTNACLQMFVDDFQAPVWGSLYYVTLNGLRVPALETVVNAINQTGPIGRMVTLRLEGDLLSQVSTGRLEIRIDDDSSGAGDGYAIDFVKLLINRTSFQHTGAVSGRVRHPVTSQVIPGAIVRIYDQEVTTDAQGIYTISGLPAGLHQVSVSVPGLRSRTISTHVISGTTNTNTNITPLTGTFTLTIQTAMELNFHAASGFRYDIESSPDMQTWTVQETIYGNDRQVTKFKGSGGAQQLFWRVRER